MDPSEALATLRAGARTSMLESSTLEFKQQDVSLRRTLEILADAVVCLANSEGGHVVLGVNDAQAGSSALVGVQEDLTTDTVLRGIFDRTRPALSVPVREFHEGAVRLLVVEVPKGAVFYANAKGTSTRRVGTECRPFPPEEQRQALASRGLYDWSAQVTAATVEDLDPDEIGRLRRLLRAAGRSELAAEDTEALLHDLRLVDRAGKVTHAGLLLVGAEDALSRLIPHYGYAYQYRPSSGSESTARFRERRPLLAGVGRIIDAVEARRSVHALNLSGAVQLQLYDYPSAAARELVVNAFVHRDYEIEGAVEGEHSPERLTISNPGSLVFGVTPENILTHPSTPRNRLLLDVVTALQVAERTGQGVDRAYREMLRAGKPPPLFTDGGASVEVTLSGGTGNDAFVRFLTNDLPDSLSGDVEVLLALDLLRARKAVSAELVAPLIQRPIGRAQQLLENMADHSVIEPSKRTARRPFPSYSLTPDALQSLGRSVTYHRPLPEGADVKVVSHIQEYGFITNQTLRRLFDVGVYPARDMLKDMQNRKLLVKLDRQRTGPGVRYGPGPAFPATHE